VGCGGEQLSYWIEIEQQDHQYSCFDRSTRRGRSTRPRVDDTPGGGGCWLRSRYHGEHLHAGACRSYQTLYRDKPPRCVLTVCREHSTRWGVGVDDRATESRLNSEIMNMAASMDHFEEGLQVSKS